MKGLVTIATKSGANGAREVFNFADAELDFGENVFFVRYTDPNSKERRVTVFMKSNVVYYQYGEQS